MAVLIRRRVCAAGMPSSGPPVNRKEVTALPRPRHPSAAVGTSSRGRRTPRVRHGSGRGHAAAQSPPFSPTPPPRGDAAAALAIVVRSPRTVHCADHATAERDAVRRTGRRPPGTTLAAADPPQPYELVIGRSSADVSLAGGCGHSLPAVTAARTGSRRPLWRQLRAVIAPGGRVGQAARADPHPTAHADEARAQLSAGWMALRGVSRRGSEPRRSGLRRGLRRAPRVGT